MTTRENESLGDERAATPVDESMAARAEGSADQAADPAPATDSADRTTGADRTTSADSSRDLPEKEPLVPADAVVDFRARWEVIQQAFVDDPRSAVTDADTLVGDLLEKLSSTFDQQHQALERQWSDGEPSTEDLRSALQRYRSFFQRLLTI
jgi:hypothetical protein